MADNFEDRFGALADDANALAAQIALGEQGQHGEEARDYLRKQSRIADLQIDTLRKKDEFELSHLRFRRFSDYARFALEIAGFLVVLLIVCGLGTMVWNASLDHDLVVDSFSMPPDIAQSGLTGSVLAGRVLDRFGKIQAGFFATTQSAGSYRADGADTVRVEIPDTGISLGELNRYLRAWLGHEKHVTGDLVQSAAGFALTTRYGSQPGITVRGKTTELDALIDKSAEQIFAAALPYRYVEYLVRLRRFAEARSMLPGLASQGSSQEKALANSAWANFFFFQGDMPRALEKGREAARLDPDNPITRAWLSVAEGNLGHDEAARNDEDAAIRLWRGAARDSGAEFAAVGPLQFTAYRDEMTGDFAEAMAAWLQYAETGLMSNNSNGSAAQDAASVHDAGLARRFASMITAKDRIGRPESQRPLAWFYIALAKGDFVEAVKRGREAEAILQSEPDQKWTSLQFLPDLAYAMAKVGDRKGADALIASAPIDCDNCTRARGRIAALNHDWAAAASDFTTVATRSPHEPFAETWWGEMLMRKGDLDGAIAEFHEANQKGPHFADPLEMWGEALMAKNRSDVALTKFEEADKYAPNWGRLHLKWGEALVYAGKRDEAKKQFALASALDLSVSEKSELLKDTRRT